MLMILVTQNSINSIGSVMDFGDEPSLLATSLNCIVAQRLARRLCLECREAYWPDTEELAMLGLGADQYGKTWLYKPTGCVACAGTGYSGRVALYEVLPVEGRIRSLIGSSTEEIFAAAVEQGMATLGQDGVRLCLSGVSSLEEVKRVTGDRLV